MPPPTTHATSVRPAPPTRAATICGPRNTPDPMIPPITAMVAEKRPRRRAEVVTARENDTGRAIRIAQATGRAPTLTPAARSRVSGLPSRPRAYRGSQPVRCRRGEIGKRRDLVRLGAQARVGSNPTAGTAVLARHPDRG